MKIMENALTAENKAVIKRTGITRGTKISLLVIKIE